MGLFLVIAQSLIEYSWGRAPLSTLIEYFRANQNPAQYGSSPWYGTWLTWLALFYFPFSVGLFSGWRQWLKHPLLLGSSLIFVLAHSLVAHKEERFLYPILGISLMLMAVLWNEKWGSQFERRFFRPVFFVLNGLLLAIGCFVNTQLGEVGVPLKIQAQSDRVLYLDHDSLVGQGWMHELFIRGESRLVTTNQPLNDELIRAQVSQNSNYDGFVLLTSNPEFIGEIDSFSGKRWEEFICKNKEEMVSLTDRWLYNLNPKRNFRRRPTWFVACWRQLKT
jgi:hypothetical protein